MSLLLSLPALAQAQATSRSKFIQALDRMMVELAPHSARTSKAIREAYRGHLDLLVLNHFDDLETALFTRGVAPLPSDPLRFNLAPRVNGPAPIGEKDLANQTSYIAARPATIGALLAVASRVTSGPIEVTSLVRHTEYQGALRSTNPNATTSVPMHTMGLAFDIALVNSSLERAYEIRDVLLRMQKAGEILFIGERKQLVFHVVPHPSQLGHFTHVYAQALGAPAATTGAHVVAFSPVRESRRTKLTPEVTAEVIAVLPAVGFGEEWWGADHAQTDLQIEVTANPSAASAEPTPAARDARTAPMVAGLLGLIGITGAAVRRRPEMHALALDRPRSNG